MGEKLQQGDHFPTVTLDLLRGGTMRFPDDVTSRYAVLVFYRGHW